MVRQTQSMRIHKQVVINHLKKCPLDKDEIIPHWEGTVEEYIQALESSKGEYFVGGILEDYVEE